MAWIYLMATAHWDRWSLCMLEQIWSLHNVQLCAKVSIPFGQNEKDKWTLYQLFILTFCVLVLIDGSSSSYKMSSPIVYIEIIRICPNNRLQPLLYHLSSFEILSVVIFFLFFMIYLIYNPKGSAKSFIFYFFFNSFQILSLSVSCCQIHPHVTFNFLQFIFFL